MSKAKEVQKEPLAQSATVKKKTLKITERLPVNLTDKEILAAGRKMADLMDQLGKIENEGKAAAKTYKAKAGEISSLIDQQQLLVRNGYEIRPVDCDEVWDLTTGLVRTTRLDTGEQVSERKMNAEERQGKLFVEVEVTNAAPATSGLEGVK